MFILFVDDDEHVLQGLKRLLRANRDTWEMGFVTSGADALKFMATCHVDVIVSDMRMPGMDGAELLARVRTQYPGTVRIVLSGFAEREAVLKTIGPSHRYLAKPCSREELVGAIEGSLRLHTIVHSEKVREKVSQLTHLPTLPGAYSGILRELQAEYASAESLAAEISPDISISAQLMKITNSAYFSLHVRATTVKQAVQALGFENVRAIVLLAGVFDQFRNLSPAMATTVEALMRNSLELGLLAQELARAEEMNQAIVDQAFCAGLLSHIGTLLMISNYPSTFSKAMEQVETGALDVCQAEIQAFGTNHAELGSYLLALWGFTDNIVEAVAYHHAPGDTCGNHSPVLGIVHAAQYLLRTRKVERIDRKRETLDSAFIGPAYSEKRMVVWEEIARKVAKGR